jgi:hypothetical protein
MVIMHVRAGIHPGRVRICGRSAVKADYLAGETRGDARTPGVGEGKGGTS